MAARKEFPVKVRRVAVTNKKTGVKYIEERRYQYDPAKGYNVLLSSRRTGEKILEGETVTTRCRPKKKPAEAAQTAELSAKRTRVGALDLIRHAGAVAGLESSVRRAYPNGGTSEKLLSVSQYLVSTGETVHNVGPGNANMISPTKPACPRTFATTSSTSSAWMNPVRSLSSGNWPVRQAMTNSRPSHSIQPRIPSTATA